MNPQVEFDAAKHEYKLDGRKVPGVTGVIKASGLMLGFMPDDWYLEFGTAVHEATALDDRGELDEDSVDPEIWPRLRAWRRFRAESRFEISDGGIEMRVSSARYSFCGTIDRLGRIAGPLGVLDIKTGGRLPWHQIQTAGYALTFPDYMTMPRWSLSLNKDETYRLTRHEDRSDFRIFIAAASLANWKADKRLEDNNDGRKF